MTDPKKVLVADDDQDVLDDLRVFLDRLGLPFDVTRDVDEAVRGLKNDPAIEVLVVGTRTLKAAEFFLLECLSELQRQGRAIRTILISNYAGLKLMQRAIQLGVADLLHGPLSLGDIGPAVMRASSLIGGAAGPRGAGHELDISCHRPTPPLMNAHCFRNCWQCGAPSIASWTPICSAIRAGT